MKKQRIIFFFCIILTLILTLGLYSFLQRDSNESQAKLESPKMIENTSISNSAPQNIFFDSYNELDLSDMEYASELTQDELKELKDYKGEKEYKVYHFDNYNVIQYYSLTKNIESYEFSSFEEGEDRTGVLKVKRIRDSETNKGFIFIDKTGLNDNYEVIFI